MILINEEKHVSTPRKVESTITTISVKTATTMAITVSVTLCVITIMVLIHIIRPVSRHAMGGNIDSELICAIHSIVCLKHG